MNFDNNASASKNTSMPVMDGWHDFVKSRDRSSLLRLLHPDVIFESPLLHTPQHGAELTAKYLLAALNVLAIPGFKYTNEWRNDKGAVLEFHTTIEGITINGVDIVDVNDDATLITHFKVMVRPLKASQLLLRLMTEELAPKPQSVQG